MNKKFLAILAVATLSLTACKKETTTTETTVETTEVAPAVEGTSYAVQTSDSKINWVGEKVSGSTHSGTLNLQSGDFIVNEGKVVGGTFVIDMNTITVTDITDAEKKAGLEGHLKGLGDDAESQDHFFNVTKFPTATFQITNVTEENGKQVIEGNLTMKEKTNPVKFTADVVVTDDTVTLKADIVTFDRTLWGVNYSSGSVVKDLAADKIIKDEIKLSLDLVAKK